VRVLIVSQYFWPENFRINDLARGLVERGHNVTVLTGIPNYPAGTFFPGYGFFRNLRQDYHGVKVKRVPLIPRGDARGINLALNYVSYAFFACIFSPFICRERYDLIFVCQLSPVTVGLPALFLKKLKKIPVVFWILDLWPESLSATGAVKSPNILRWVDKLVRFIYRGCNLILTSSKGFIPCVASKGVAAEQTRYFPNWNEPEYLVEERSAELPKGVVLPQGFRVMFAGNIGVAQDFDTILSAAEKLRDFTDIKWIVLGDGRQSEWVAEQIKSRGLINAVHLLGRHLPETMPAFFAQADAMLVTLRKEPIFELTVPGKIQSYMACGKPIVAAVDGEGGRIIIESGAGLAASSGDADALAQSVLDMYRLPREEREAMGMRGQQFCADNFDRDMLINRLEGWMGEVVAAR